jgi:hypothetical protein
MRGLEGDDTAAFVELPGYEAPPNGFEVDSAPSLSRRPYYCLFLIVTATFDKISGSAHSPRKNISEFCASNFETWSINNN